MAVIAARRHYRPMSGDLWRPNGSRVGFRILSLALAPTFRVGHEDIYRDSSRWLLKIAEIWERGCFCYREAAVDVARNIEYVIGSTKRMQASHRFKPFGDI